RGESHITLAGFSPVQGRIPAGNAAEDRASAQAMLSEAPLRFACAIEAWYHLALHVQDLRLRVGPETGERIVDDRRRPRRVKRGLLDLVSCERLLEVCIDACVHEGV